MLTTEGTAAAAAATTGSSAVDGARTWTVVVRRRSGAAQAIAGESRARVPAARPAKVAPMSESDDHRDGHDRRAGPVGLARRSAAAGVGHGCGGSSRPATGGGVTTVRCRQGCSASLAAAASAAGGLGLGLLVSGVPPRLDSGTAYGVGPSGSSAIGRLLTR